MELPNYPICGPGYTYEDGAMMVYPECAHERDPADQPQETVLRDAVGNILQDGGCGHGPQNLKVKGSSNSLKIGTKVKSIRLVEGDHNIDCKIEGFGAMQLKSEFVKKV